MFAFIFNVKFDFAYDSLTMENLIKIQLFQPSKSNKRVASVNRDLRVRLGLFCSYNCLFSYKYVEPENTVATSTVMSRYSIFV